MAALRRRQVLSGLAAAGLAGPSGADGLAVRQDVARLAHRAPEKLAVLSAAVGELQRRSDADPSDPSGWHAHAMAHHAVCAAVSNDAPSQVHGCWWFLPWHRAFLAVTEWKLRAISGDPTLALPYWNWSTDRWIPEPFSHTGSPLARANRYTPDRALASVEVDYLPQDTISADLGVAGLGAQAFQARTAEEIPSSFGGISKPNIGGWHGRSRLETVPHNAIHNYVGGETRNGLLGDMTELGTAALDPVFYAHHANLDRLWEIWRADPVRRTTEPRDPAFLNHRFGFPWLDGTIVTLSVADTMDPARLGYRYDSPDVFRNATPPVQEAVVPDASHAIARDILAVPPGAHTLQIGGVLPGQRPMTVVVTLSRPHDQTAAIPIGAIAIGRKHSAAEFPDTMPHFDIRAAIRLLGTSKVEAAVVPLSLGTDTTEPPPFVYGAMTIAGPNT